MKQKTILVLIALFAIFGSVKADPTGSWAEYANSSGIGDYEKDNTFYINNRGQLAGFAALVNSGYDFSSKTVVLRNDLDLGEHYWVPIGSTNANGVDKPFKGTFNGDGHTIKNIITAAPADNDDLAGLFGKLREGGTIKNLKISNSTILGSAYIGGIVAYNYGGTITNCVVESTVTITSCNDGGAEHLGGIAGMSCGIISGCVSRAQFDVGSNNNMYNVGGILGYSDINLSGGGSKVIDCMFFGSTLPEHSTGQKLVGPIIGNRQNSVDVHTNDYYTTSGLPNSSGVGAVAYAVKSDNSSFTLNFDGTPTYTYNVSNISSYSDGVKYGNKFYAKSGSTVKFKVVSKSDNVTIGTVYANSSSLTADGDGFYSVTIGNADVTITADLSVSGLTGGGTAGNPYTIGTVANWETFVSVVASGYSFSGQYVQLTSDITLSFEEEFLPGGDLTATPHLVGTDNNRFSGTFDGGGHTITLAQAIRRNNTPNALFRYVRNATIKNLIVDGTFLNRYYASYNTGLVAVADGATTISNCLVKTSVQIDATSSSVGNAGIVGQLQNTSGMTNSLTMTGCAFLGKLLKYDDDVPINVGGLLGYASAGTTATFTDCLFDPTEITVGTTGSCTLARYGSGATLTFDGCYYTKSLGEAQGTRATINSSAGAAGEAGTSHGYITSYSNGLCLNINNGSTYYIPTQSPGTETTISLNDGSANSSALWINMGRTVNVTLEGRTLKPNVWNTLCLPFELNASELTAAKSDENHPFYQATIKELDFYNLYNSSGILDFDGEYYTHFNETEGMLYLYFKDAEEIVAGKPYIVKWTGNAGVNGNLQSPTFSNVTIATSSASTESAETGVSFVGTFDPAPLTVGSSLNLYLGSDENNVSKLYYPSGVSSFSINAFRGYFIVNPYDSGALDPEYGVRGIYMNIDEDEASSIKEIGNDQRTMDNAIYDLSGRKLDDVGAGVKGDLQSPCLRKGLYIKNGRKIVIK